MMKKLVRRIFCLLPYMMLGFGLFTISSNNSMMEMANLYYYSNEQALIDRSSNGIMPSSLLLANFEETKYKMQEYVLAGEESTSFTSRKNQRQSTTTNTLIVAFANSTERYLAVEWYLWLQTLGYKQHKIVALDEISAKHFERNNIRHDVYIVPRYPLCNSASTSNGGDSNADYYFNEKRRKAIQWKYVYWQLKGGLNVLVTSLDVVFTRYEPLSKFELGKQPKSKDPNAKDQNKVYDVEVYFSYHGRKYYPQVTFHEIGFTIYNGLLWLRSTDRTIQFIKALVDEYCTCPTSEFYTRAYYGGGIIAASGLTKGALCEDDEYYCNCNDQIEINHMINSNYRGQYFVEWSNKYHRDRIKGKNGLIYKSSFGKIRKNLMQVHVWDRTYAFYDFLNNKSNNHNHNNQTSTFVVEKIQCPPSTAWAVMGLNFPSYSGYGVDDKEDEENPYAKYTKLCFPHNLYPNGTVIPFQELLLLEKESGGLAVTKPQDVHHNHHNIHQSSSSKNTVILTFANSAVKEGAVEWYNVLTELGYTEQRIVAMDQPTADYLKSLSNNNGGDGGGGGGSDSAIRYDVMPYTLCNAAADHDDPHDYNSTIRKEIYGLRWKYVYSQYLSPDEGNSKKKKNVLLSDIDNVFTSYRPLYDLEYSDYDVYHSYGTTYPTRIFEEKGFTVCGGLSWWRADSKTVLPFVRDLVVKHCGCSLDITTGCDPGCSCDDQVEVSVLCMKVLVWKISFHVPFLNGENVLCWLRIATFLLFHTTRTMSTVKQDDI